MDEQSWRKKEILKICLYILLFVAEPIGYYTTKSDLILSNFLSDYKIWLDILLFVFLAIIPFGITLWLSYQPIFLKKIFPWTFISEILLLLNIILRSKLAFDVNVISMVSVITYFLIQFYTSHKYIFMIPIENLAFLLIYVVVYNKSIFTSNKLFILSNVEYFFPVYLVII